MAGHSAMKTSHRIPLVSLLGFLALPLLFVLGGCTQVQVAPNTLGEFKMGELQVVTDRSFAATYDAAKRGMQEASLFQTRDDRRASTGELRGRDSADTQVVIKLKELAPNRTDVRIRYGVPGNLALAQQVYQSIQKSL
jgi:hypothetical protein